MSSSVLANLCNATRVALMVLTTALLTIGLGLNLVATIFPTWHTVHVTTKPERIVHHGLWMHCVYSHPTEISGQSRLTGLLADDQQQQSMSTLEDMEQVCDLNKDVTASGVAPQAKWLSWKRNVLILMCAAFTMGLITLLIGFCGYCHKWFTVAWAAGAFVTAGCCLCAVAVYFVNGHEIEGYRTYSMSAYNAFLQELGWCFWAACGAVGAYLLAAIIAVPAVILTFRHSAAKHDRDVMIPWNHNHHTAV